MEKWELFLRGLGRSIETFVVKMIEKGRTEADISVPEPAVDHGKEIRFFQSEADVEDYPVIEKPARRRFIRRRELGDLEDKIYRAFAQYPGGCTLKDLAKTLDMQWHFLRIPLRQLVGDGKIEKDGKLYRVVEKEEEPAPVSAEKEGSRRRVVDARVLEIAEEQRPISDKIEMSAREKEILRFKILTAFRGRPEGLTLVELAAVLGRSMDGLELVVRELMSEKKVAEGKGGKYHLA